jgi:hypothetical protein
VRKTVRLLSASIAPLPTGGNYKKTAAVDQDRGGGSTTATVTQVVASKPTGRILSSSTTSKVDTSAGVRVHDSSSIPTSANHTSRSEAMKEKLILKLMSSECCMFMCGVTMVVFALTIAILGTNVQYSGPQALSLFILVPAVEQVCSYTQVRLMAIAIKKVNM